MAGFWTIIAGVVVYVLSQFMGRYVLDPIKDFHGARADISYTVLRFQAPITNARDADGTLASELWTLAAGLIAKSGQIPLYDQLSRLRVFRLPSSADVLEAAWELNGVAGTLARPGKSAPEDCVEALRQIAKLLNVKTSYKAA